MYFDKPAFAVSYSVEEVVQSIEDIIKSKYWHEFKVASIKLVYTPYWIFNYDAFVESKVEQGQEPNISDSTSGKMGLNAVTDELDEEIIYLYESGNTETIKKPEEGKYQFEVQRATIREHEAARIVPVKLASKLSMPRNNIIVSGLELVYVPKWIVFVDVAEGNFKFEISAVTGDVKGGEEVPERERGWLEVSSETLDELKEPGAWVNYTEQVGSGIIYSLLNNPLTEAIKHNKTVQMIVLALIAAIVILWSLGFL